jgi:hypothetical protein
MEPIVELWCHFVGVTDPVAIQVATGAVAGGALLFLAYITFLAVFMGAALIPAVLRYIFD